MGVASRMDPRRSFAARLVAALLVTVGLMLAVTLLVVRSETAGQVERVTAAAAERAHRAFEESEAMRREQLALRATVFTDTRRTYALVEEAIAAGATSFLAQQVGYTLRLTRFDESSLAVLTDARGEALLTQMGSELLPGDDPAGIAPLARELLDSYAPELLAYRRIEGRLYTVRVVPLDHDGPVIGATAFGLPILDADAESLGRVVGAEVCLVAEGACLAGTRRARGELAAVLGAMAGDSTRRMLRHAGERWAVLAEPLSAERPDDGSLVMAVPLEAMLSPFDRIRRALAIAGGGALLLAALLSVLIARGLTRPVRELAAATLRVAQGDYGTRVHDESRDELGQLARSFNAMTEGLALKEQYRGVLDKVVSRDVAEELLRGELRLGGENRDVTVLFADIRGFTDLSEGMEPQEVIALLNETMERLGDVVEAAGGVVDKYVGDEIMAVFGAPMAQPDHVARAVAAARAMQTAMAEVNDARAERGLPPVLIGAGINSGVAVAGNMGSPNRLNYTVLGETVNLAARLCAAAAPGEVLISEATRTRLPAGEATGEPRSLRLKGFSAPVPVHPLTLEQPAGAAAPGAAPRPGALPAVIAALAASAFGAGAAPAQSLPTLSDLGVGYLSGSGAVQLDLSGRVDVEGFVPSAEPAWIIPTTEPFAALRARLFADLFLGERVFASAELRVDRGEEPAAGPWETRLDQALVRIALLRPLALQVGKFVSPFGGWPQRHHTVRDPFVRPPLSYDYRTMISPGIAPGSTEAFVDWKDDIPTNFRPTGAPPVWGAPYQWGAMVLGSAGPAAYRVAVMNSAPSSEPESWGWDPDRLRHPSFVANVGLQVSPALRVEGSWNRGPYLEPTIEGALDPGWAWHDYLQEIYGIETVYAVGRAVFRGEAFADRWEVPNVPEDAWDLSYYVEGQVDVGTGAHLAARWGEIRFNELGAGGGYYGGGVDARWDYDARRLQLAAGYRVFRNAGIAAEYMLNHTDRPEGDPPDNLFSVQLWWQY